MQVKERLAALAHGGLMMRKLRHGADWLRLLPMLMSVALVLFVSVLVGIGAQAAHHDSTTVVLHDVHHGGHNVDEAHRECGGGNQCSSLAILHIDQGVYEPGRSTLNADEPSLRVGRHWSPLLQPPIRV